MHSHNEIIGMSRGTGTGLDRYIESFEDPLKARNYTAGHDQDLPRPDPPSCRDYGGALRQIVKSKRSSSSSDFVGLPIGRSQQFPSYS
jgi:hypothetical protein